MRNNGKILTGMERTTCVMFSCIVERERERDRERERGRERLRVMREI